jgi:peptide chain release factor 3
VLNRDTGVEVLTRSADGVLLALIADRWRLGTLQRAHPAAVLEPLVAATD